VVGIDAAVFLTLQLLQGSSVNYTPLFALPILLTAVLGSLRLALGTAAGITLLLLFTAVWTYLRNSQDSTPLFVQTALSGLGYFVIAFLANQLSTRLASEGQRARAHLMAASMQRQVNELVIESLPDGVMIVDDRGLVRAANPAARQLLGLGPAMDVGQKPVSALPVFNLKNNRPWAPLWELTQLSIGTGQGQEKDITLRHDDRGPQPMRVRTRLTTPHGIASEFLCVLFLQDLRELEARMRTEKLVSMGRMSTAVAHEIRNPLAAIAQANALLGEDLAEPRFERLTTIIDQNVKRLGKIVDDVLSATHVLPLGERLSVSSIALNETVQRMCTEWAEQNRAIDNLQFSLQAQASPIYFEQDHLRRLLVNLLDNARRHGQNRPHSIVVGTSSSATHEQLTVWSEGEPMDHSVERHLFEPFFSSQSRSSGLGLYICRQLCEGHGATIAYQRSENSQAGQARGGNAFTVQFLRAAPLPAVNGQATRPN
jgi:two-component system sensor histidine kinase PilS (NtrC family)